MAFRTTAVELTRQYKQNRDDIEALYDLLDKTNKRVEATETKVDKLTVDVNDLKTDVGDLKTNVGDLTTRVGDLTIRVDDLTTRVDGLDSKVDQLGARFDTRFDRLEQLFAQPPHERVPPPPQDTLRTPQEKRLGFLEMRVNGAVERSNDNQDELERHNRMFDVCEERFAAQDRRFDSLGSQMAEVLGILRGTNT